MKYLFVFSKTTLPNYYYSYLYVTSLEVLQYIHLHIQIHSHLQSSHMFPHPPNLLSFIRLTTSSLTNSPNCCNYSPMVTTETMLFYILRQKPDSLLLGVDSETLTDETHSHNSLKHYLISSYYVMSLGTQLTACIIVGEPQPAWTPFYLLVAPL